MFLNKKYFTTWFWIILVIKLIVGSLLASSFMSQGFIPFVNYFLPLVCKIPTTILYQLAKQPLFHIHQ